MRVALASSLVAASLFAYACTTFSDAEEAPAPEVDAGSETSSSGGAVCTPVVVDPSAPPACGADLLNDAANCGACGRACVDVKCVNGRCDAEKVTDALKVIAIDGKTLYTPTGFDISRGDLSQRPFAVEQFFAGISGDVKRLQVYSGQLFVGTTVGQVVIDLGTKQQRANEQVALLGASRPDGLFFAGSPSYYLADGPGGGEILSRIDANVSKTESKSAARFQPVFHAGPDFYWTETLAAGTKIVGPWERADALASIGTGLESFIVDQDVAFFAAGGHLVRAGRGGAIADLAVEAGVGVAFAFEGNDLYYAVRRETTADIRYFVLRIDKCAGGRPVLVFDINVPITDVFFIEEGFVMVNTANGIFRVRR